MSPKAGFLRSLFKAPILTEKLLFLETSLYYRIFDVDSLDHWHFLRIWLRDIPNVLAFKVEAALTEYDLTWKIHLDKLHVFNGEWGSIWLKNNWVWFDFSHHGFARKIYSSNVSKIQILLSSWKCSNSNTSKGLFALLFLVGLIKFSFRFCVKSNF